MTKRKSTRRKQVLIGAGIVVMMLVLAGCRPVTRHTIEPTSGAVTPQVTPLALPTKEAESEPGAIGNDGQQGFTAQGRPFRGNPKALVTIEEFSSYQCTFCARHFRETYPQLMSNYVESGRVHYVFWDFPLPSQPQAFQAAEAANCAGQVAGANAYWAMHDLIMARQADWSGQVNTDDIFKQYAGELDLEQAAFDRCLDSEETRALVEASLAEANARGVDVTPTFFINGEPMIGAQPYPIFKLVLDIILPNLASTGGLSE